MAVLGILLPVGLNVIYLIRKKQFILKLQEYVIIFTYYIDPKEMINYIDLVNLWKNTSKEEKIEN